MLAPRLLRAQQLLMQPPNPLQGDTQQPLIPQPAPGDFVVRDIHIDGLQRISEGTVFNYLPVNIGDRLTPAREREALRALYATGFFRDVELRRDGDTLIVAVAERPSLEAR